MIGKSILHYKILEKLGEGGMGIVWKAEDTKLNRQVAIKVLPPHLLISPDDKARFHREAKAAAALNHSNIATVYEINESDEKPFIVMEYVEGATLDQTIAKGPLPLQDAIAIAIQIADGLAAAHKKGVVHRDVKASNILYSAEKKAKILDFGLAKTSISTKLTQMGTTIGTVAYMSPEQVQGKEVDHRTDLWSLGILLYEMIAGHLPFKAEYDQAVFYSIQNENPDPLTAIRTGVPMSLEWIVNKMMAKDSAERYQSAADLLIDLKAVDLHDSGFSRISKTATHVVSQKLPKQKGNFKGVANYNSLQLLLGIIVIALLSGTIGWYLNPDPEIEKAVRKFEWAEEWDLIEISPDGKKLAYSEGNNFWIRHFDSYDPVKINTDEVIQTPLAWSPKSDQLAFYLMAGNSQRKLLKVSAEGGQTALIANYSSDFRLCYWGYDDSLVFVESNNTFYKISSAGGVFKKMYHGDSTLCKIEEGLQTAYKLPGKDAMIVTVNANINKLMVQNEDGRKTIYTTPAEFNIGEAVYSNSGHIVFHRFSGDNEHPDLWALPFDLDHMEKTGEPFLLYNRAGWPEVTDNGTLFHSKQVLKNTSERLVRISRKGAIIDSIGQKMYSISWPNFSPDGKKIVFRGATDNQKGIWLYNNKKQTLLLNGNKYYSPFFSSNNSEIYFEIYDETKDYGRIYKQGLSGLDNPIPINKGDVSQYQPFVSSSGKYILSIKVSSRGNPDIAYEQAGKDKLIPLIQSPSVDVVPVLSPDERFMVYASDKSGRFEVYLTRFPDVGVQRKISGRGQSHYPQWVDDGIYYTNDFNELMYVKTDIINSDINIDSPQVLFDADQSGLQLYDYQQRKYAITRDGTDIVAVYAPQATTFYYVLIDNWFEEYRNKNN